ncbi:MAG: TonB-dependent receptor [FCB group bacterium]|nr:TonB-dependent receptor [FCB group bacterium]
MLQAASLSGFVRDAEVGEPLAYANVILLNAQRGTATDVHGYFILPGVPVGADTLQIMMIGYETASIPIELRNTNQRRDITLNPLAIQLDEVNVSGERAQFEQKLDVSRINLTSRELRMTPAFVEDDVFRTFQLLPSVTSLNDFSAALIVRGGSPDENLVNLDNTQIYNPYHIGGIFSTFNTDAISNAEFISGGYQAEYGGHLSSVINLTTKEGNSKSGKLPEDFWLKKYVDYSNSQAEISLLSSKILAEGPSYKGSWFFSGRRTYFDQLARAYYSITNKERTWDYFFWDVNFKIHTDLNSKHRLTYVQYSGLDDLYINVGGEDFPEIKLAWDWGNRTSSLNWRFIPNSEFLLETTLARAKYFFDVGFNFTVTRESSFTDSTEESIFNLEMENVVLDQSVDQRLTWFRSENQKLTLGWNYKILKMTYREDFAGVTMRDYNQSPYIFALYGKETWRPHPLLAFDFGMRISRYQYYNRTLFDPRINFKYFLLSDLALKGSWGMYSQFLFTINQDDQLLRVIDFWQPITKDYIPQRAEHYVLGLEYWVREGMNISLDLYYKPYRNVLDVSKVFHPEEDITGYVAGTAKAWGAEILIKKMRGDWFGWLGYSYSFIERSLDYNENGVLEKDLGEIYRAKYDIPHSLNLVLNYQSNKRDTYGLSLVAHSGQPFTPPSGKVFFQSYQTFGSQDNPYQQLNAYFGKKHSARYPTYFRVDLSYIRKIKPFGVNGKFKLQVINATNHFNVLLYNWDLESSPAKVTAYSMFPILLSFGWEFEL